MKQKPKKKKTETKGSEFKATKTFAKIVIKAVRKRNKRKGTL